MKYPDDYIKSLNTNICVAFPETGFVRINQIIGDSKANPPIPPVIPVSKSTWWNGVKTGRFPKSIKMGAGVTVWRVEDIRELINHISSGGE